MPNTYFPTIQTPNTFYDAQANTRANQALGIDQRRAALEEQRQQNQLMALQEERQNRQKYNQLVPGLLGMGPTEAQLVAPALEGPASASAGTSTGNQLMPGGGQSPDQEVARLAQAYQLNPEGTEKLIAFSQQRQQQQLEAQKLNAQKVVREAQFVLASKSPKVLLKAYFPDRVDQITQAGHDFESMTDDDARHFAQQSLEHAAPMAGLDPTKLAGEGFTLGEGQKRFDAKGNVIAAVEKGPAEETAADRDRPFQHANALRDEYNKQSTNFQTVTQAYQNITTAAKKPSAAGDLSLIFGYMKLLDPGSTVREGEFSNAENAGGIPARIRAKYNKVINGERLDDSQRNDFVDQAGSLYKGQQAVQSKLRKKYSTLATRAGVAPQDVVGDEDPTAQADAASGPRPIKSDADYNALPSGTEFIAPDGSHRKKP